MPYSLPPVSLLDSTETRRPEIDHAAREVAIRRALAAFEVEARVVGREEGPLVTLYELDLAPGTRVAQVIGLAPDLAIHLAVPTIRVAYPLPGRTTVGIEVPNPIPAVVRLRSVIERAPEVSKMGLPVFPGEGPAGQPVALDLAVLGNLLVAGTTGSGKSVSLTATILSMLLTRRPEDLRLILVDPLSTELTAFEGLPHLLAPAVRDTRRVERLFGWLVREMEARSALLAFAGVRAIEQFNALGKNEKLLRRLLADDRVRTHLPHIVLIVDELADLMMVSAKEVEAAIVRLSQKSRAVGIHLVLATQRPSVDVVTGLLKSSVPNRISFKMAAMVDSRTVLDQPGAERLLGRGDMLLMKAGSMQLERRQGVSVGKDELRRVVEWWREHGGRPEFDAGLAEALADDARDPLFDRAAEIVIAEQRGSVSMLQRMLEIGFSRAGNLIDALERDGIVGPQIGSKPRKVLPSRPASPAVPARQPDPLFQAAALLVVAERKGSVERLRHFLDLTWDRAGRLMDALEAARVVERVRETGEWRVKTTLREWRKRRGA